MRLIKQCCCIFIELHSIYNSFDLFKLKVLAVGSMHFLTRHANIVHKRTNTISNDAYKVRRVNLSFTNQYHYVKTRVFLIFFKVQSVSKKVDAIIMDDGASSSFRRYVKCESNESE